MIKKIVFVILITLSFSFSIRKPKKFIPPGTIQITETLFADVAEVTNFSWLEYEIWTKMAFGKNSKEHLACLPDTNVWSSTNEGGAGLSGVYYRHPAFKNYPVVGVSYEQALAYCKWRTDRVQQFLTLGQSKNYKFEYCLPDKKEWELLSWSGVEVFNGPNTVKCVKNTKDKKVYQINYQAACFINDSVSHARFTSPIKLYSKNIFGLYDMIGNVSEMVAERGISKGGSWKHELEDCRTGKDIPYSAPESWLGFRCVCRVAP